MEFVFNHWEKIATIIGVFVSFFAGLKTQKIENYKRASEIYSQMIGNLENDFNTRFQSLNGYVTQLEQMNTTAFTKAKQPKCARNTKRLKQGQKYQFGY